MGTIFIEGPAGPLEASFEGGNGAAAVLAHPHPQMGGTMHDAVLDTAARQLLERDIACLRFNFRGAGASAGQYDNGDGERDDLRAALQWLTAQAEGPLTFVGYSFGSWVGTRVIEEDAADLAHVMLIAPPIGMMSYPDLATSAQIDVFAGTADQYVDLDAARTWADRNGATVHSIEGADHFFGGHWDALGAAIAGALDDRT